MLTRYQKRNLARSAAMGLAASTGVLAATMLGLLTPLERPVSDQRMAWCQFDVPSPTDQLIHLDIDDAALEDIHRWPWPRGIWADILDELTHASARTVAFDILFTEPQQSQAASAGGVQADADATLETDDVRFARAIARHGRVILPVTFSLAPHWPGERAAIEQLIVSPATIGSWEAYQRGYGRPPSTAPAESESDTQLEYDSDSLTRDQYLMARRRALFELLCHDLFEAKQKNRLFTLQDAQAKYFPDLDPAITDSPQIRLLERQYARAAAYRAVASNVLWGNPPEAIPQAAEVTPPTPALAWQARYTGFVDVVPDPDGVVRQVHALLLHGQQDRFAQLGLALAQLHLSDDERVLRYYHFDDAGHLFNRQLPGLHIPYDPQGRILIPWTGPAQDWQGVVGREHHLAIGYVWEAAKLAGSIRKNRLTADQATNDLYRLAVDPAKVVKLSPEDPTFENDQARFDRVNHVLGELASLGYPEALTQTDGGDLSAEERQILDAIGALAAIKAQHAGLVERLSQRRADLQRRLQGKAVLVGYTASGLGDIITTPLHTRCPGVIAHGAIFNGVMTNGFWGNASWRIWIPMVLLMGLAGTAMAMFLSPGFSAPAVLLLAAGYTVFNGLVVFDRWNVQLLLVAPVLAAVGSWAACTLSAFIFERRERARITRRFQNYVDPTLVNYVIENPQKARLEGEARTMSVVFTDLEGFTKLSSTIHERVVPVINHYLEEMIPPIHEHRGYVNKFLGDGIMFFFGAPRENAQHAQDAMAAILAMQQRMTPFNESLQAQGLPPLRMRAGMTTGKMIVGDAGSNQRSDYTVMGDQVNLAARLESANKACGTSILINDTAAELLQDQYLLRPVGRLQVVGRSQAVMCFEPLMCLSQAGYPLKKMVEQTHRMIQAYTEKRWEDCLACADDLAEYDDVCAKLASLYRENVALHREHVDEHFDGRIELTSK